MIITPRPLRERMALPMSMRSQRGFLINPYQFAATASWRIAYHLATLTGTSSGWSNYTLRTVVAASLLGGAASKARLTLRGRSGDTEIDKCYIQVAAATGEEYDYDSAPVQVLFGGLAGSVLGDSDHLSDEVTLSIDGSRALVLTVHFKSGPNSIVDQYEAVGGITSHYKLGDDSATVDASGYTSTVYECVRKLELFG